MWAVDPEVMSKREICNINGGLTPPIKYGMIEVKQSPGAKFIQIVVYKKKVESILTGFVLYSRSRVAVVPKWQSPRL